MNRIAKTLVSLLLCCCLCLNLGGGVVGSASRVLTLRTSAEEINLGVEPTADEMRKALDNITKAMEALDLEGIGSFEKAFETFMNVANYVGIAFVAVNGAITFLRLIGLIDDPTVSGIKSILDAMARVEGKLDQMDQKLDKLTQSMLQMKAEAAFYSRGLSAQSYQTAWRTFYSNNITNVITGNNSLMTKYNTMLKAGIRRWCENIEPGDRVTRNIDNASQLVLLYDKAKDGSWTLVPTLKNDVPTEYQEYKTRGDTDHAYLVLSKDAIPEKVEYNVDTVAKDLPAAFKAGIEANKDGLDGWNFDLTEENIQRAAGDAYVLLSHRIAAAQMQTPQYEQLATDVINAFKNFCSDMLAARDGMDAMYQSLMLTHGFEGEISDSIKLITDQLITLTGIYGPFVASVMSQSADVEEATRASVMTTWVNTVNELGKRRDNFLTGEPGYSYVMGGVVEPVELRQEITLWAQYYRPDASGGRFDHRGTSEFAMWQNGRDKDAEQPRVSADSFALLNLYFRQTEQTEETRAESFKKYLAQGRSGIWFDEDNTLVLDFSKPMTYNFSTVYVPNMFVDSILTVTHWWKHASYTDLRYLPSSAGKEYINNNRMIQGTVYDMSTGTITSNQVLMAAAIYGEGHWYWKTDEIYFFLTMLDHWQSETRSLDKKGNKRDTSHAWGDRCGIRVNTPAKNIPNDGFSSLNTYSQTIAEIEENLPKPEPVVTDDNCYIGVTVYDGYQRAEGALVELVLNGETVQSATTGSTGGYMSPDLNAGDYNVVVTYKGEQQSKHIGLVPNSAAETSFTFNGNIISEDPEKPFDGITAEGLPQNLKLAADWYEDREGAVLPDLRSAAGKAALEVVELSLLDENDELVHVPGSLVTVKIPYKVNKNKTYKVYRSHEGAVEALTSKPNAAGEYMEVGKDSIILHANKFSVYAIASAPKSSPVKPDPDEDKPESKPAAPAVKPLSPKTGDNSAAVVLVSLLGVCALLTAAGAKRREE